MPFPFKFLKGRNACCLGAGADGLALQQFQTLPIELIAGHGLVVQRSFNPFAGAYVKTSIQGPSVDLVGNGQAVFNPLVLDGLSQISQPGN